MEQIPLLFSGSSHPTLAQDVAHLLNLPLGKLFLGKFPDGETKVEILEPVEGKAVFVFQTLAGFPNDYLMELFILVDALKRGAAKSITAVIPYLGYCRQDRKDKSGKPITAKLVANLLMVAGIDALITFDLHAAQIEGFFDIPVYHLQTEALFMETVKAKVAGDQVVVAPDIGSVKIAEAWSNRLSVDLAIIKKERQNPFYVTSQLIGSVKGKHVVICDDLCSTASTLVAAADVCVLQGAKSVIAVVSHGLFASGALQKIEESKIDCLLMTDSVPQSEKVLSSTKIRVFSIAQQIVEVINLNV